MHTHQYNAHSLISCTIINIMHTKICRWIIFDTLSAKFMNVSQLLDPQLSSILVTALLKN